MTDQASILRARQGEGHARVGFIELFFDLVFVFAITRLSHSLLAHPTLEGAAETLFLLLAVWIVWMWTTWAENWLDARHAAVRILMLVLMGAGLVMSAAIPDAFGGRGLVFALAYVFMHNLRNAFTVWALRKGAANERRNFQRIQAWLALSGVLWIAGAFVDGEARWAIWSLALLTDFAGPWCSFWTPGMGKSTTADWAVDPAHMAERCGLFVILSLGESIIILGATFSGHDWDAAHFAAFGFGFAGAVAMWWIYFATAAERAEHAFAHHADAGRIARAAYTYAHIPIVAGIILTAVADELLLAHPTGHAEAALLMTLTGGAALFLAGNAVFSRLATGRWPLSHLAGVAGLAALWLAGAHLSPLMAGGAVAALLFLVALWESRRDAAPKAA